MSLDGKRRSAFLLAIAIVFAMAGMGCTEHHYYRVYDPYYTDYHVWNNDEIVYYRQWSRETHRDANRDFRKLVPEEQKEYWTWRHNHGDRDHDRSSIGRPSVMWPLPTSKSWSIPSWKHLTCWNAPCGLDEPHELTFDTLLDQRCQAALPHA